MRLFIKTLLLVSIIGCVYWISKDVKEPEPWVCLILSIAGFFGAFIERDDADVQIYFLSDGGKPKLKIINKGEKIAKKLSVRLPDSFPLHTRDRELIPKELAPQEEFSVRVPLTFGMSHSYDIDWSWSGNFVCRAKRSRTVTLQ